MTGNTLLLSAMGRPRQAKYCLDFSDTVYMDDSAALVVEQLVETALTHDTPCIVMGLSGAPAQNLHALDVLRRVPDDRIVGTWDEARETALGPLGHREA